MRETLEMLKKLQEIDQKVDQLAHSKVDLPGEIDILKKQVQDLKDLIAEGEDKLAQLEREKREEELGLQTAQDELRKYQEQLYRIKTNREYDAIQAEIDAQKARISEHEENILNIMTTSDELTETLEQQRQELESQKVENVPKWEQLENELSSIEDKMAIEKDHRKNVTVRLDQRVLAAYERIRRGKNGLAIVAIRKRACGGCFKTLPPQKIQEVRKTERIMTCENCGRILYWDENLEN
jgi:predicted  nucleic acid-binding Zn-ribbon protein